MSTTNAPHDTVRLAIYDGRPLPQLPTDIADLLVAAPWTTGRSFSPSTDRPTHIRQFPLIGRAWQQIREQALHYRLADHHIAFDLEIGATVWCYRPGMPFITEFPTDRGRALMTITTLGLLLPDLADPQASKKARNAAARRLQRQVEHLVLATAEPKYGQQFPHTWDLPAHLSIDDIPF